MFWSQSPLSPSLLLLLLVSKNKIKCSLSITLTLLFFFLSFTQFFFIFYFYSSNSSVYNKSYCQMKFKYSCHLSQNQTEQKSIHDKILNSRWPVLGWMTRCFLFTSSFYTLIYLFFVILPTFLLLPLPHLIVFIYFACIFFPSMFCGLCV